MFYWSQIPLVRAVIPLLCGIIVYRYLPHFLSENVTWLIVVCLLTLLVVFHGIKKLQSYKFRWVFGVLGSLVFLLLGFQLSYYYNSINQLSFKIPTGKITWIGEIIESPSKTAKSLKTTIKLNYLIKDGEKIQVDDKILCYIKQSPKAFQLEMGDVIVGKSYLNKISNSHNPYQFDYAEFLANKNVFLQNYVEDWELLYSKISIYSFAESWRKHFLKTFIAAGLNGDEYAVASALTLGYKNDLGHQIRNAYSGSGAVHILSVSGLHVGIIYILLTWFTNVFKKMKRTRWLSCLLILAGLWSYAVITGLSSPVQRSAIMFSFIVVADALGRNNNIFNSLAASVLLLVMINPNIIFEVGFQLSYFAVIGIVLIHPKIYPLLYFKNKLWDKIWSLVAVSLAAQAATLALVLYYFHQFPNLFLITNILVVPLAFIILVAGIVLLVMFSIFTTTFLLGDVLKYSVWLLNKIVEIVYHIPNSVTEGIYINVPTALLIIVCIASLILFFYLYKFKYLFVALISIFIIGVGQLIENVHQREQSLFTIYNVRDQVAFSSVAGKNATVLASFGENNNLSKIVKEHLAAVGINSLSWNNIDSTGEIENRSTYFYKNEQAKYVGSKHIDLVIPKEVNIEPQLLENDFRNIFIADREVKMHCKPSFNYIFNPGIPFYQRKWIMSNMDKCDANITSTEKSIKF